MHLEEIKLANYRNYETADVSFSEGINVFLGENAQGKTNLMEAIYVLAMTRSHRIEIDGQSFIARHGELLLDAVLSNGIDLPYDCRAGHCGTCCVRLVAGDVRGGQGSPAGRRWCRCVFCMVAGKQVVGRIARCEPVHLLRRHSGLHQGAGSAAEAGPVGGMVEGNGVALQGVRGIHLLATTVTHCSG